MNKEAEEKYRNGITETIPIWPSIFTVALISTFFMVFLIARAMLKVDSTHSELAIYQTPTKKTEIMTKQTNIGAQNNVHAAIACGLMAPPPGYERPKTPPPSKGPLNGEPKIRSKKSKF
jgi:hypothetical protein